MSFDIWWDGLREDTKAKCSKELMKLAYSAGSRSEGSPPPLKKFKFFAGRRKVTVSARTLDDAKEKAIKTLDQRTAAAGLKPPSKGWSLSLTNPIRASQTPSQTRA